MVRMAKLTPLARGYKGTLSEAYATSINNVSLTRTSSKTSEAVFIGCHPFEKSSGEGALLNSHTQSLRELLKP